MSLWLDEVVSWQVGVIFVFWVGVFLSRRVEGVWGCELTNWWVDELVGFWTDELIQSGVVGFSGVYKPVNWFVSTLHVKGVFILCWHHKDNKLLSIYRQDKDRDGNLIRFLKEKSFIITYCLSVVYLHITQSVLNVCYLPRRKFSSTRYIANALKHFLATWRLKTNWVLAK